MFLALAGSTATFYAMLTKQAEGPGDGVDIPSLIEAVRRAVFVAAQVRMPPPALRALRCGGCAPETRLLCAADGPEERHAIKLSIAGGASSGACTQ